MIFDTLGEEGYNCENFYLIMKYQCPQQMVDGPIVIGIYSFSYQASQELLELNYKSQQEIFFIRIIPGKRRRSDVK